MSEIKVNSVVNSTGDNDSGLDLSTNDQVIIKTANTTALTVDSSQGVTVAGAFTSRGIDDNADATAITIDSSENVGIGTSSPSRVISAKSSSVTVGNFESTSSTAGFVSFSDANTTDDVTVRVGAVGDNLVLQSGGLERMRIHSNGKITQGTSAIDGTGGITFAPNADGDTAHLRWNKATSSSTGAVIFNHNGSFKGGISYSSSGVTFSTSSDYRVKENVDYDFDATTRLKQLRPARFNFIADADTTVDGFLAHEVQSVVPEAITGTHNEVDDDGNAVMQGIDQSKLVPLLVKTIQELEARITALENA